MVKSKSVFYGILLCCLSVFASSQISFAQQNKCDALSNYLDKTLRVLNEVDRIQAIQMLDSIEPFLGNYKDCRAQQINFYAQRAAQAYDYARGDLHQAGKFARKALQLHESEEITKPRWYQFLCLVVLEDDLERKDLYSAFKHCGMAQKRLIDKGLADKAFLRRYYNYAGIGFLRASHHEQALEYFVNVLKYTEPGITIARNNALQNVGLCHMQKGDYGQAIKIFKEVLNQRKFLDAEDHEQLAMSYSDLHEVFFLKGDIDSSLYFIEKFNELDQSRISSHTKSNFLADKMNVLLFQEKYDDVFQKATQEIEKSYISDDSGEKFIVSPDLFLQYQMIKFQAQLGLLKKDKTDVAFAKRILKQGKELFAEVDQAKLLYQSKLSASDRYFNINQVIDILLEVYIIIYEKNEVVSASEMEEIFQLQELKQKVLQMSISGHDEVDSSVVNLLKKSDELERILNSANSFSADSLFLLKNELLKLQDSIVSASTDDFYLLMSSSKLNLKDLIEENHLVSYFPMDEELGIFEFYDNQGKVKSVSFSSTKQTALQRYVDLIGGIKIQNLESLRDISEGHRLGNELYKLLISPIDNTGKSLVLYPGVELNNVPFVALNKTIPNQPTDYESANYLVEEKKVAVVPSLRTYQQLKLNHVANLDPSVTSFYDNEKNSLRDASLPRLSYARIEAKRLVKEIGGTLLSVDTTSNKNIIKHIEHPGVLNFSVHTILNDQSPKDSYLYIENDRSLYLSELKYHPIQADIVIFNSCQSGVGAYELGDGFRSMTNLFVDKGVSTVVSSLWKTNDYVGSSFTPVFCSYIFKRNLLPLEALRKYQLDMIRKNDPVYSHPYYWSGYQCLSYMNYEKNDSRLGFLFMFLTALVLGLFLYLWNKN